MTKSTLSKKNSKKGPSVKSTNVCQAFQCAEAAVRKAQDVMNKPCEQLKQRLMKVKLLPETATYTLQQVTDGYQITFSNEEKTLMVYNVPMLQERSVGA